MSDTAERTAVQYIYVGRRQTQKGTLAYFYASAANPDDISGFKQPLYPGLSIGSIVEIYETSDGRFSVRGEFGPKVVGAFEGPEPMQWSLEDRAAVMLQTRKRESDRIVKAGEDPLRAALDPIRKDLAGMQIDRRAVTVAWIMDYLLTGTVRTR